MTDASTHPAEFVKAQQTPEKKSFMFIIEHLDPELGDWSALEYRTIAKECRETKNQFILCSVLQDFVVKAEGLSLGDVVAKRVEELFPPEERDGRRGRRVCLLDPQAKKELSPEDGDLFEGFLFGGILGMRPLPFLLSLVLVSLIGDDPPRDRTSELRKKGYEGRRLGPVQMTTDTAVRVTRMVVQDKILLEEIPYVDFPELKLDEHESTEMPFRYVKGEDGGPVMPDGMIELIKKDADKGFDDFLQS
ncbi:hypothetical protein EPUS_00719 [Endocarpon pusillum Z07020]|uniref:Uncharacterized protein n=1 Tax=Endocarpon pusillum (strain Z07020 / HMAS-L-300199) TaxID=1263415 RepID=U1HYK8_ENDPU|nr:uncharacterized protein EPUS_00719 [Endocarpon pusillum Z07020]ERF74589.1 hypothetical protein EPUS_00719 [Endocarpon pusillum Z07020]